MTTITGSGALSRPDCASIGRSQRLLRAAAEAGRGWSRGIATLALVLALPGCSWVHALTSTPARSTIAQPVAPALETPAAGTPPATSTPEAEGVPAASVAATKSVANPPSKASAKHAPSTASRYALAAGEVGYYMDVLQGRLMQELGKGIHIERRAELIVLSLPSGAAFDGDGSQLNVAGRALLQPLAQTFVEYRLTLVSVQLRHLGASAADTALDGARAAALSRYLGDAGIAARRVALGSRALDVASVGDAHAVDSVNVEIQLSPLVGAVGNAT